MDAREIDLNCYAKAKYPASSQRQNQPLGVNMWYGPFAGR